MAIKVETPNRLVGTEKEQLLQVYAYLYRLSENLNVALNNLTADNFASATEHKLVANNGGKTDSTEDLSQNYNALRSLIINTATIVRGEMDKIATQLNSHYESLSSEWGTYQENMSSTIEATAEGILQKYGYDAKIESLQEIASGFSQYIITTEGFIKQGFVDYDENNIPIIGIAIGQGLTTTKVTVNGEVYEQIDDRQSCAFYTANKVSFRINGIEVAYLSNNRLYIHDIEITGGVYFRGEWSITTEDGFLVQWIGGDV